MDRKPASRLGQFVPIVRKLWISSTFDFQRALHLPHIRLLVRRFNSAPPTLILSGGHKHFPIREWLCSRPGFKMRRILSCVLHEREALILRGNLGISCCKLKILKELRLYGGPDRDRTDDLFHAMENQQLTAQTAKELSAGIAVKTGTVGANWHQIDAKNSQL